MGLPRVPRAVDDAEAAARIYEAVDFDAIEKKLLLPFGTLFKNEGQRRETLFALARLVTELGPKLKATDTILSDDASGRLPSLILREMTGADTFFVQGGKHGRPDIHGEVARFLEEKKEGFGKTLFVTEHLQSGGALVPVSEDLERMGVDFRIATVSLAEPDKVPEVVSRHLSYGEIGNAGSAFYGKRSLSGVEKDMEADLSPHAVLSPKRRPDLMRMAREDMKLIASALMPLMDETEK